MAPPACDCGHQHGLRTETCRHEPSRRRAAPGSRNEGAGDAPRRRAGQGHHGEYFRRDNARAYWKGADTESGRSGRLAHHDQRSVVERSSNRCSRRRPHVCRHRRGGVYLTCGRPRLQTAFESRRLLSFAAIGAGFGLGSDVFRRREVFRAPHVGSVIVTPIARRGRFGIILSRRF